MRVLLRDKSRKLDAFEITGASAVDDSTVVLFPSDYSDQIILRGVQNPERVIKDLFAYSYLCLVQYPYEFARFSTCEDIPFNGESEREIDLYEEFELDL